MTSPATRGSFVYAAGVDGVIRAFDTATADPASPLWQTAVGYQPGESPLDDPGRAGAGCA